MSYILEALKRADAERERGAVPNLHSHATPAAATTVQRPATRLWIAALAALVLLLVAALWWALMRQTPPPAAPAAALPSAAVVPPPPVETPRPAATAPVRPAPTERAAPVAQKPAAPPFAVAARTSPASASATATRAAPSRPAVSAVAAAVAAPPAKAASAAETRVYSIAELPEDVRQQLPKLAINGGTYSAQAAYRMLIVNGQVLHENDEPVPGVTLETIRPKDAVLRFRGYRYSVGY